MMNIKQIIREEIDSDWDFVGDMDESLKNTAFEFNPPIDSSEKELYFKLIQFLLDNDVRVSQEIEKGLTMDTHWNSSGVVTGIYVGEDEGAIWTSTLIDEYGNPILEDEPTYEIHIKNYAEGHVNMVDARKMLG